ncbi:atypical chemokine receptor 1 isoform X1 [Chrysemys picta bellii]|uniref:atypical chemokine receptor 1 isoform X1 n=3 Tax=Chrysemys picta bellii TaxID=8478 RepID=UPI0032B2642D
MRASELDPEGCHVGLAVIWLLVGATCSLRYGISRVRSLACICLRAWNMYMRHPDRKPGREMHSLALGTLPGYPVDWTPSGVFPAQRTPGTYWQCGSPCFLYSGGFTGAESLFLISQLLSCSSSLSPPLGQTDKGRESSPVPATTHADTMGNCIITVSSRLELNTSDYSFENMTANYSYDYDTNDILAAAPCQSGYCSFFRSHAFNFLAVVCALGLLSNLALVVALANCWGLWGWPLGRASLFQLTVGTTIFTAMLPFFAAGISQGWVIGDGLCKVAYMLWYGSLFAEGLLVAAGACSAMWDKWVPSRHHWCMAVALWVAAILLAVPAALLSGTEGHPQELCMMRDKHWWHLAHVTSCLAVFILLPAALGVAKAMLTWRKSDCQLRVGVTCLFFLLWVLYGTALLLDSLVRRQLLDASCHFYEFLDFFLGLSEGLGVLHCCLGPLLLLGAGLYHRRTHADPGPLRVPAQHVPGLELPIPNVQKA